VSDDRIPLVETTVFETNLQILRSNAEDVLRLLRGSAVAGLTGDDLKDAFTEAVQIERSVCRCLDIVQAARVAAASTERSHI
jgi:hypothetical protein